jgi:hypothetical protein
MRIDSSLTCRPGFFKLDGWRVDEFALEFCDFFQCQFEAA